MMSIAPRRSANFWRVFGVPILLGLVSAIGLLSALLGDGLCDALSWAALGAPIAIIIWYVRRPARVQRNVL
jgi:hypothetical protein